MGFRVFDQDGDNEWDREEPILIMPYEGMITPYMFVVFDPYANVTTLIDLGDTTVIDTAFDEIEDVEKGDVFRITINIRLTKKMRTRINSLKDENTIYKELLVTPNSPLVNREQNQKEKDEK